MGELSHILWKSGKPWPLGVRNPFWIEKVWPPPQAELKILSWAVTLVQSSAPVCIFPSHLPWNLSLKGAPWLVLQLDRNGHMGDSGRLGVNLSFLKVGNKKRKIAFLWHNPVSLHFFKGALREHSINDWGTCIVVTGFLEKLNQPTNLKQLTEVSK